MATTITATDCFTVKASRSDVLKCFRRAKNMYDLTFKDSDTEKKLMHVALLSDDILDGIEIFDNLESNGMLDEKYGILSKDRDQLEELVQQAKMLEEESKKQLDKFYDRYVPEVYKINQIIAPLSWLQDLEIMISRLEGMGIS